MLPEHEPKTPEDNPVVAAATLTKAYAMEDTAVEVLKEINLSVQKGQFVAIYGPSGAGKTTLLNLISGIDKPTSGKITVFDLDLAEQNEDALADYRCNQVGFVFQSYNLISTLTVAENIAFPMEWKRSPSEEIQKRVAELIQTFGLEHRANHFPAQLSGGEQQRVAFARALANDPPLLLADEPTGNLDTKNGQKIIQILQTLKNEGKTVIVSTHDRDIMPLADLKFYLEDGKLATPHE
ncbi:MAG: ABC transporter ATP-binding protein [Candidatus Bathyarchaeota archaeon]|nr:ABC transporter ATP-binding protein [Candidatus Bathyarchaeota archaeon]